MLYQRGVPPDTTYIFKHALIQETAYQSMLISRRQRLHQQIAQTLAERFPETLETQPEVLAHHYTLAGLTAEAITAWHRAGQQAVRRSGNREAIGHLMRALDLLRKLPDGPEQRRQELDLQTALGPPLMATKGYASPEVERVYGRVRELCRVVGETPELSPVLLGLCFFYGSRGEMGVSLESAAQLLSIAERTDDALISLAGRRAMATMLFFVGEFAQARSHLEKGVALYEPERHRGGAFVYGQDLGVTCRDFASLVLWHLGYPDQALNRMGEARALARDIGHVFSLGHSLDFAAWLHYHLRDGRATREAAEADIAHATEHGIALFGAHATILRGWALAEQGFSEDGLAEIHRGLAAYRATGGELERSHWLALLAEAYLGAGDAEAGLTVVADALVQIATTGARLNEAELYRLKGELLLKQGVPRDQEAELCFRQGVEIAQRQTAKSLELRATVSLSRLLHRRGKREEARRLLAEIYGWFSEGFDTRDLQEAKALLDELS